MIWLPTFDAENYVCYVKENRPFVTVLRCGRLLPKTLAIIALAAKDQLILETGHSSAKEGLLVVEEAKRRKVPHVVVANATANYIHYTIPQMKETAANGAFIEFVYGEPVPNKSLPRSDVKTLHTIAKFTEPIRGVGPASCSLASNLGQPGSPLRTAGLAALRISISCRKQIPRGRSTSRDLGAWHTDKMRYPLPGIRVSFRCCATAACTTRENLWVRPS